MVQMLDICELLRANTYPGRGIMLGLSEDGKRSVIAYFIMGRSENSRNRVFMNTDDGIRTEAFDPDKLSDPSLVIYNPVRSPGGITIVTNGTQTDTIAEYLRNGKDYSDALYEWEFEPDPPIYTPRISGIVYDGGKYSLSILKSVDGDPGCCCRYFFNYSEATPGLGHFISTYKSDGNPPPSFEGEPFRVAVDCGYRELADKIWEAMDEHYKVALFVCETDISTGKRESVIINKLGNGAAPGRNYDGT